MSLSQWADHGWLKPHRAGPAEIRSLFEIVDRDLRDAAGPISPDWRFGIAYNAVLKLATILLSAEGYRAEKTLQHYRTLQAISLILGADRASDVQYLETCRRKRNVLEYESVGGVTAVDADELARFARSFRDVVVRWLAQEHPDLASPGGGGG
jgi:hypothetical protein